MEMLLTIEELSRFSKIAYQEFGIKINDSKRNLMSNRMSKRIKELKLFSFVEYYNYLVKHFDIERQHFADAITTNETFFFRGLKHFSTLTKEILPNLQSDNIRVWSAACSSGEEAYSLAIALNERLPASKRQEFEVFASDISSQVLKKANRGIYNSYSLRLVREQHLKRYFNHLRNDDYQVKPQLRKMVKLGNHNLLEPFPKGKLDIIFCRNVLIYFDRESKQRVLSQLMGALKPNGYLFVGESEIIPKIPTTRHLNSFLAQKIA